MKRPKLIVLISVIALLLAVLIGLFVRSDQCTESAPFRLEVGYTESDAGIGIEHPGTHFPSSKPLLVLAIYGPHQSNPSSKSTLTVLSKTTQEVLQKEEWTEIRDLSGNPVQLHNEKWKPGTYVLRWERDGKVVSTQEITLE